jgi:hypothetical protein
VNYRIDFLGIVEDPIRFGSHEQAEDHIRNKYGIERGCCWEIAPGRTTAFERVGGVLSAFASITREDD